MIATLLAGGPLLTMNAFNTSFTCTVFAPVRTIARALLVSMFIGLSALPVAANAQPPVDVLLEATPQSILHSIPSGGAALGELTQVADGLYAAFRDAGVARVEPLCRNFQKRVTSVDGRIIELPYDMSRFFVIRLPENQKTSKAQELCNLIRDLDPGLARSAQPLRRTVDAAQAVASRRSTPTSTTNVRLTKSPYWEPSDPLFDQQWWAMNDGSMFPTAQPGADARLLRAWGKVNGILGQPVKVAVWDKWLDVSHPDLPPGTSLEQIAPHSAVDGNGHGTKCAGIIAAVGNNGIGIAGANWNVDLHGVTIYTETQQFSGVSAETISNAANWCIQNGVAIVSLSWKLNNYSAADKQIMREAIANMTAAGILLSVSMANENGNFQNFPATLPGAMAVGAIWADGDRWDNTIPALGCNSLGSNWGSWIDVVAPGGKSIVTTAPGGQYVTVGTDPCSGFGGTSAAAPLAAGVASLVRSARPDWPLIGDDLVKILGLSATREPGVFYPNQELGYGVVNADAAIDYVAYPKELVTGIAPFSGPAVEYLGLRSVVNGGNHMAADDYFVWEYRYTATWDLSEPMGPFSDFWIRESRTILGWPRLQANPMDLSDVSMSVPQITSGSIAEGSMAAEVYVYKFVNVAGELVGWFPTEPQAGALEWASLGEPLSPEVVGIGDIYLSTSPVSLQSTLEGIEPYESFDWYVMAEVDFADLGRPDANGVDGIAAWELSVNIPANLYVLERELLHDGIDIGAGSENWIVGGYAPLNGSHVGATPILHYRCMFLTQTQDVQVTLGPSSPSSTNQIGLGGAPSWTSALENQVFRFDESWRQEQITINPAGGVGDTTPPSATSAFLYDIASIDVIFDEPLDLSMAESPGNYRVFYSSGDSVEPWMARPSQDQRRVLLGIAPLPYDLERVEVYNAEDVIGNVRATTTTAFVYDGNPPTGVYISEVMLKPSAFGGTAPQWFEVFNSGDQPVSLSGAYVWISPTVRLKVAPTGLGLVGPGDHVVIAQDRSLVEAQGVAVHAELPQMLLGENVGTLRLQSSTGAELCKLDWDSSLGWPITEGASMQWNYQDDITDAANWREANPVFGVGDHGTPGLYNADATGTSPNTFVGGPRLLVSPSPSSDTMRISFARTTDQPLEVQVFDLRGRIVSEIPVSGGMIGNDVRVIWNGHDRSGNRVSSGVYFLRLTSGKQTLARHKVSIVR